MSFRTGVYRGTRRELDSEVSDSESRVDTVGNILLTSPASTSAVGMTRVYAQCLLWELESRVVSTRVVVGTRTTRRVNDVQEPGETVWTRAENRPTPRVP